MPLTRAAASSAASRSRDLGLERDREGVLLERRLVVAASRRPVVEAGLVAQRGRARPGDPDRLRGDAVRLGRGQDVRRGEAPRAIDEDADAEPFALAGGHALDAAGLDRDALLEPPDDADIGISGALGGGRVEGAIGQVSHEPRSLAEGSGSRHSGIRPTGRRVRADRPDQNVVVAGDRLDGQVEPEAEDEDRGGERHVRRSPARGATTSRRDRADHGRGRARARSRP